MLEYIDREVLEELSSGSGIAQIQDVFYELISKLSEYLKLELLYKNVKLAYNQDFIKKENSSVLALFCPMRAEKNTLQKNYYYY